MSVTFAGNGKQDVGDGGMKEEGGGSLQAGGPVEHPKGMEEGKTADGRIVNNVGEVPQGGGVKFTAGNDW